MSEKETKAETKAQDKATDAKPKAPEQAPVQNKPKKPFFNYKTTEAEDTIQTRNGEHKVKVVRNIDKMKENQTTVNQTISHQYEGKKESSDYKETSKDIYTANSHETRETILDTQNIYKDKAHQNKKESIDHDREWTTTTKDGITINNGIDEVKKTKYAKNGEVSTTLSHIIKENSHNGKSQSDEYNEWQKDDIKRHFKAQATATKLVIKSFDKAKKKEFSGHISLDGSESYLSIQKEKAITIDVDKDGKISGRMNTFDGTTNAVTGKQELSPKQLRKELKAARAEAKKTIQKVSNAKTAQEYLAAIPAPTNIARAASLSAPFGPHSQNEQPKPRQFEQEENKVANISAEQILQQRLDEYRQH